MGQSNGKDIKVWDLFVRFFHWTLVLAFFTAYLVEEDLLGLHVWAGYIAFSLVILRLAWGFLGTEHARFSDFVYTPARIFSHIKDLISRRAPRYIGHNPAGGIMIIAVLLSLLGTTITGMLMFGAESQTGPLGALAMALGIIGEEGGEAFKEVHEVFANLTLALVFLHILGVAAESLIHRENLVRSMFTGRKPAE